MSITPARTRARVRAGARVACRGCARVACGWGGREPAARVCARVRGRARVRARARARTAPRTYASGVPNINDPEFDEPREQEGFRATRARIGRQAGSERLGASVWEVPPGEAAYPYHFHHAEEELVIVLEGRPSLRTPDGWRELQAGEVVAFPRGEDGGHQLVNRTRERVRFLAVSTNGEPDIVVYPDSGKLAASERLPDGGGLSAIFRLGDTVDYYEGERWPRSE
jgi:uncharacterized cupin superfamily protein